MELTVVSKDEELTKLALHGRLDTAGVDRIETAFTVHTVTRGRHTLVLFQDVTFLTSMGIRMLVTAAKGLARKGAKMAVVGPTDLVRETLLNASLDEVIPIVADEQEGLQALQG